MRKLLLFSAWMIWIQPLMGQVEEPLPVQPWDLSYETLLNQNGIKWDHQVGTLFTWLKDREEEHRYISEFVAAELAKYPESCFLIDHPTFPSGGRTTVLGIKNDEGHSYFWRSTDEGITVFKRRPLTQQVYEQVIERLQVMRQRGYENQGGPERAYAGFLSVYNAGKGRQILLHINDFMEFDVENQQILRIGKIFEIETTLQVNNQ